MNDAKATKCPGGYIYRGVVIRVTRSINTKSSYYSVLGVSVSSLKAAKEVIDAMS